MMEMKNHTKEYRNKVITDIYPTLQKQLEIFVNTYKLHSVMSAEDIEDMFSDAVLKLLELFETFDQVKSPINIFLITRFRWACMNYIKKQKALYQLHEKMTLHYALEWLHDNLDHILTLNREQVCIYFKDLNIDKEISFVCNTEHFKGPVQELFQSLPEKKQYIILCYYVLNKSIKEIADDLDLNNKSGWIYKMKKDTLTYLKNEIEGR